MKALTFLEYASIDDHETRRDYEIFLQNNFKLQGNFGIVNFYSQSFSPKLISVLFEGWELKELARPAYNFIYENINVGEFRIDDGHICVFMKNQDYWGFVFPNTLENFISDCQRAGIELIWKDSTMHKTERELLDIEAAELKESISLIKRMIESMKEDISIYQDLIRVNQRELDDKLIEHGKILKKRQELFMEHNQ